MHIIQSANSCGIDRVNVEYVPVGSRGKVDSKPTGGCWREGGAFEKQPLQQWWQQAQQLKYIVMIKRVCWIYSMLHTSWAS